MRIGGLATGMETEVLLERIMAAERMPLNKMQQDKQLLEWKRDGFRDVNRLLLELDELMFDMRLSKSYKTKQVTSSQSSAVTATASTSTPDGSYRIEVSQLATNSILVGGKIDAETADGPLGIEGEQVFYTVGKDGEEREHKITIEAEDTLSDVLKKINGSDADIRAFYDKQQQKVVMESKRTGQFAADGGPEIYFGADSELFTNTFKLSETEGAELRNGQNAKFTYNGMLELESTDNSYELNGIRFNFHNTTVGDAQLTVQNDTDEAFDNIMKFIDKYNEIIDELNKTQTEEKFRDFKPLTEEQREEMSDDEIKKWEEKAKSGVLRGENILTGLMGQMRQQLFSKVETGGAFSLLSEIGIETSKNYMDGGKLVLKDGSEDKLRAALEEDVDSVMKLFTNEESTGLMQRLDKVVDGARKQISNRAGGQSTLSLQGYELGRQMKNIDDRISAFEARLEKVETRYWNQFTAMEKAIQKMNEQSDQMMNMLGGGMF